MLAEQIITYSASLTGVKNYKKIRNRILSSGHKWLAGRCDLYRFYKDKLLIDDNGDVPLYLIDRGLYEYQYFNICFFNNMLSLILSALANGCIPYIDIRTKDNINIWDEFFIQPYPELIAEDRKKYTQNEDLNIVPDHFSIYSKKEIAMWGKIYKSFFKLKDKELLYVNEEIRTIIGNKKILGVICRGTDYVDIKLKGHPAQPKVSEVIELSEKLLSKNNYDAIYLATEDGRIDEQFRKRFGDLVLVNKREYYDKVYCENESMLIKDVHFARDNDNYWKGLEYISSICILSKCNGLIGGNCGGAQAAIFLNENNYEDLNIFNLGLY